MSDTMQLYSGEMFNPLDPEPSYVNIEDIAHSLSMLCRYNGHCKRFYSVAEHSVLLSHTVDPENAKWGLLHDATEAYMGDMVRPLKHEMPEFMDAEDNLEVVIAGRFNLGWPMPAQVKEHDTRIVADEREQIMRPSRLPWSLLEGFPPLGVRISGWSPSRAEAEFMSRYQQLFTNTETENTHVR